MHIDLHQPPDQDIFRDKKKNMLWFSFFMWLACVAVAIGWYAVYSDGSGVQRLADYALGLLVAASFGVTRYGNRLQKYKALFPPQREKLAVLREQYPVVEEYCAGVEALQRRFIRGEYEACVNYAEKQEGPEAEARPKQPVVYGPVERADKNSSGGSGEI